jgi:hypothetical protein
LRGRVDVAIDGYLGPMALVTTNHQVLSGKSVLEEVEIGGSQPLFRPETGGYPSPALPRFQGRREKARHGATSGFPVL